MRRFGSSHRQHGYVLVMLVLVLVVLLGIAALALDLGRLYVLRTEMQNAADAAALAAAAELDANPGATERAELAGRGLIQSDSHFANVKALLAADADMGFEFFSTISPGKSPAAGDEDTHFVRVTLNPGLEEGEGGRYGIDLFFLPVLQVIGLLPESYVALTASALAGRHFYMCRVPPVMLCDPFEGSGGLKNNISAGQQIALKLQGGPNAQWSPGMFGYLDPDTHPGGGVPEVVGPLANEDDRPCPASPVVLPQTGNMAAPGSKAINTRFDEYGAPHFNRPSDKIDYPPAPNITSYGGYGPDYGLIDGKSIGKNIWRDENLRDLDDLVDGSRIGNGVWNREDYLNTFYPSGLPRPLATTRHGIYEWEISNGYIPVAPTNAPAGPMSRRVIFLSVLSCNALGVKPNQLVPLFEPDGFAKLFITERAGDPPNSDLLVEYIGWAQERDEDFHVVIQLYE